MFDSLRLIIAFWLRVWNIELTLVPSLQTNPKKHLAVKYVWLVFEKQPSEGFFKKDVTRILAEFTRKILCRNLFFEVFLWILRLICAKSVTY